MKKDKDYIVISDLNPIRQKAIKHWLVGQTMSVIREEEGVNAYNCISKKLYDYWLRHYAQDKEAPIYD